MSRFFTAPLIVAALSSAASAATLDVPGTFATIQDALDVAVPGDEVVLAPGTYMANLTLISPDVVIRSANPSDAATVAATVLDGGGGRIISWPTTADGNELRGLTFRNGAAPGDSGSAIRLGAVNGVIADCVFESNSNSAVALWATVIADKVLSITDCSFRGNSSHGNGGAIFFTNDWTNNGPTMEIDVTDCDFAWNSAIGTGGAIFTWSRVDRLRFTFDGCRFDSNYADQSGAVEFFSEGSTTPAVFESCTFHNNNGTTQSGALRVRTPVTVMNSTFSSNHGGDAGAINIQGAGTLDVGDSVFCDNSDDVINGGYVDLGGLSFADACDGACCLGDSCVMTSAEDCGAAGGIFVADADCTSAACAVPCPFDVTGDAQIGFEDLVAILSAWGPCP